MSASSPNDPGPILFRGDLHTHTTYSDGVLSPSELVSHAVVGGLEVLAITDHDSIGGVKEGIEEGKKTSLLFIPGVEMTVRDYSYLVGVDLHLLGYGIDPENEILLSALNANQGARTLQKREIVERLNTQGIAIDWEDVLDMAKGGVVTRGHIAMQILKKNPHKVRTLEEVFQKYIGTSRPAYIPLENALSMEEGIRLIKGCGGVAVIAHPGLYHRKGDVPYAIRGYAEQGLGGIEVVYPYVKTKGFSESQEGHFFKSYSNLADELGLIKTSGSDFHIPGGKVALGELQVTKEALLGIDPTMDLSSLGKD